MLTNSLALFLWTLDTVTVLRSRPKFWDQNVSLAACAKHDIISVIARRQHPAMHSDILLMHVNTATRARMSRLDCLYSQIQTQQIIQSHPFVFTYRPENKQHDTSDNFFVLRFGGHLRYHYQKGIRRIRDIAVI